MTRLRTRIREEGNRLFDLADQRSAMENLMNQRLGLFLIVFVIIIVGTVTTQKKIYFLSILFIGAVICWVLAYTIIRLAKKIGILTKEINSFEGSASSKIEGGSGKTSRILLGYFVPIFCSTLLVLIFLVGSSGFIDSYLWIDPVTVSKVEHKVNEVKNDIQEKIITKKEDTTQNFENVDQVIANSKVVSSKSTDEKLVKEVTKQVTPKTINRSGNFTNIDSVITTSQTPRSSKSISRSNNAIPQQSQNNAGNNSQNFQSIQSIIVEDKPAGNRPKDYKKSTVPESLTRKPQKSPPMEGFKGIESVIKK